LHVVAVDHDPRAEGLARSDVAEVVDTDDSDSIEEVARRHAVDGVLSVGVGSAAPVVAAVTERLGLPSIGLLVAHRMTHKLAMRRTLAEEGVPQPAFAAVRTLAEGRAAIATVGLPAVLKPTDAEGQTALFRVDGAGDLESHLHVALAASRGQEAILERYVAGTEMNAVVVTRNGEPRLVALSDRLRPDGAGFGVAWAHVHPAGIHSDRLELAERTAERSVAALGLERGIALAHLIATRDGEVVVLRVAARVPGSPVVEFVRETVGVDLVEVALRFALGEDVPDELALPRFSRPVALRFLIAAPGPLPAGRVTRLGALGRVVSAEGVVAAEAHLETGTVVAPIREAADRHGYVLARGDTTVEALARADHAAGLVSVEVE
jgi:cysteine synthase A